MDLTGFSIEIKDGKVLIGGEDTNFPGIDEDSFTITKINGKLCINDYKLDEDGTWMKLGKDELKRRRHVL